MILQSLNSLYGRLSKDASNRIPLPGFSLQDISLKVVLDQDGVLIDIQDIRHPHIKIGKNKRETKTLKPVPLIVPGKSRPSEASFEACILWDDTRFVFGWHGVKNDPKRNGKCLESFRRKHFELENEIGDKDFTAVCNFLRNWNSAQVLNHADLLTVKKGRVVFQISGKTEYVHDRKSILEKIVTKDATNANQSENGQCLITGKTSQPIARLHPGILNIPGSPYTGASLVSFNDSAYESYGKEGKDNGRGANSPSSEEAVSAYATALDWLLSQKDRHFRLLDSSVVYWTEEPTPSETKLPWMIAGVPQSEDVQTKQEIKFILEKLLLGTLGGTELGDPKIQFHILALSLNQGRISTRFYYTGSLGEIIQNVKKHFEQLRTVRTWDDSSSHPESTTPIAFQLLRQTSRDIDGIPPQLSGALLRSILLGTFYPNTLAIGTMNRIRVIEKNPKGDGTLDNVSYLRVAILKAWLMRNHAAWLHHHNIDMKPALDKDTPHAAYQLGRLFAVYEQTQRAAHSFNLERTIRETMFSAASATPLSVFGRLDRLNKHHLSKLSVGSNRHFSSLIDEIHQKITAPGFYPASLNLKEQSLFCIGYYHQRHEFKPSKSTKNTTSADKATT
jgi:CRISPR-associated protein Csd1